MLYFQLSSGKLWCPAHSNFSANLTNYPCECFSVMAAPRMKRWVTRPGHFTNTSTVGFAQSALQKHICNVQSDFQNKACWWTDFWTVWLGLTKQIIKEKKKDNETWSHTGCKPQVSGGGACVWLIQLPNQHSTWTFLALEGSFKKWR